MTRARRVHQGERTQSEVRDYGGVVQDVAEAMRIAIDLPMGETGELTGDGSGEALPSVPFDGCKTCAKLHEANPPADNGVHAVVKAPSGTEHLAEDFNAETTLCGRDITDDWS